MSEEQVVERSKRIYLVWTLEDDYGYYEQYDTLEDAVKEHEREEIFIATPKLLGKFQSKVKMVRVRKRKKVKK